MGTVAGPSSLAVVSFAASGENQSVLPRRVESNGAANHLAHAASAAAHDLLFRLPEWWE